MDDRTNKNRKINRREFLKTLALSGGAAACGSLLVSCGSAATAPAGGGTTPGITLDLTQPENQSLASVGGALALEANTVDSKGLLLYRSSETEVLAFSRKCTHMGCAVGNFQDGLSNCPCHGSQYDTSGKPVKGPAANPLKEYAATLSGSTLTVKG